MKKKKILIIGNSAKEYALAKLLAKDYEIYIAPGSNTMKDFATCVDIRENAITELAEFALEHEIELTIAVSKTSIEAGIAEKFIQNDLRIFAPTSLAAKIITDKALAKKILYRLRVLTPKFGIFEKQNVAQDYIKNLKQPFVIKTNDDLSATIFTAPKTAKTTLDALFMQKNQKVIIEDYIWGTPFTFYTLTDGYKALPIGSSIIYKHALKGEGGQLTLGMGSCSPNYKLSFENENFILDNVIYPTLELLEQDFETYIGILGVNGIITESGDIQILGYEPFMQDCDCASILKILDEDLIPLFISCIIGTFSDDINNIAQNSLNSVSLILHSKCRDNSENIIQGLDDSEDCYSFFPTVIKNKYLEYEAQYGPNLCITKTAGTVSGAKKEIYKELEGIFYKGIYYREDICKSFD